MERSALHHARLSLSQHNQVFQRFQYYSGSAQVLKVLQFWLECTGTYRRCVNYCTTYVDIENIGWNCLGGGIQYLRPTMIVPPPPPRP